MPENTPLDPLVKPRRSGIVVENPNEAAETTKPPRETREGVDY